MTYKEILGKHIGSQCEVISKEDHCWCQIVIGEQKSELYRIEDVSNDYLILKEYGQEIYDVYLLSNTSIRFYGRKP
jgi:hypothetical protein